MKTPANIIRMRLAERNPQGEPLSLITGQETLEELREMIVEFSVDCPVGRNLENCPFCLMSSLTYDSLTSLTSRLSRAVCIKLFEQELQGRAHREV